MKETVIKKSTKVKAVINHDSLLYKVRRDWQLLLMLLPGLLFYLVFRYGPMYGVSIAFKDYGVFLGVFDSPWVGLKHFANFFSNDDFAKLFKNTLLLGTYSIVWAFPMPVIFAIMLNEVKNLKLKKLIQTSSYLPAFLSVVVVCSMAIDLLSPNNGIVNRILQAFGQEKIYFITQPNWFRTIFIGSDIWQNMGFSAIIYIAALSGIDPGLYEAAKIDGCGRMKSIINITIPCLMPTIITMLILKSGQVFRIGYEKVLLLYTPLTYEVADVFGTFVYRRGIIQAEYSFAAAVGLFESLVALTMVIVTNHLSKKASSYSLW